MTARLFMRYRAIAPAIRAFLDTRYGKLSFSQFGEDMVMRALFARYPSSYCGYYVDIGANRPKRFSNTYYFYTLGWRGLCVDPLPGVAPAFAAARRRDLFLPLGVGEVEASLPYYEYEESCFNTFSSLVASRYSFPWKSIRDVPVLRLSTIFGKHVVENQRIDFMSVDVEGLDLAVMRSNDWQRYRPTVVVAEGMPETSSVTTDEIPMFMGSVGYRVIALTPSASFFVDTASPACEESGFLRYAT